MFSIFPFAESCVTIKNLLLSVLHSILYSILRVQFLLGNLMICCHNVVVVHNTSYFGSTPQSWRYMLGEQKTIYVMRFFQPQKTIVIVQCYERLVVNYKRCLFEKIVSCSCVPFRACYLLPVCFVVKESKPVLGISRWPDNTGLEDPDDLSPLLFWRLPIWAGAVTRNNPMCEVAIEGHFNKLEGAPNSQK